MLSAAFDFDCRHQRSITGALKEADISVRRRALDLLFAMATPANAPGAVPTSRGRTSALTMSAAHCRHVCDAQSALWDVAEPRPLGENTGVETDIDASCMTGIAEELLTYLTIADFTMREELVLKTAVLAEKCAHTLLNPARQPYMCW